MNKTVLTSFTILCLLSTVLLMGLAFNIQTVKASGTIYIRADGSIDPPTAPISTVDNITYTFTDNIYDSIVVERGDIVVDGAGYTLQGSGSGNGFDWSGINNVTIKHTTIINFGNGIVLGSSSNNSISGNNITANNMDGIWLWSSSNYNSISGNNITANNMDGIVLGSSSNNSISGNNITNNAYGIVLGSSSNNSISGNNITNNGEGIHIRFNSSNNNIYENRITNNIDGMSLQDSMNNTITGNNITHNEYDSIRLRHSSGNVLSENSITDNKYGIRIEYSSNNMLRDNTIANNSYNFHVEGSNLLDFINYVDYSNMVDGKPICWWIDRQEQTVPFECGYLTLVNCTRITVTSLILTNNCEGLLLAWTTNSTVTNNVIAHNYYEGIKLVNSSGNRFFHNNLIGNVYDQVNFMTSYDASFWDNGFEGNYWSNYTGVDSEPDGIGDTPYVIDANNTDNHPLMGMFSDFNTTSEYHVQTICDSSISDFQFDSAAITFNVTGESGTAGFCRICILKALMNDTYRIFVNGTEILPAPLPLPCSNTTHSYLYFNYTHSIQEVVIIPEFPSLIILPLFMIATLLVAIVYRRKRPS